jgi:peptide deformylase
MIELVNPEIVARSGDQTGNEGCLSIPGMYGIVTRPELVKVRAQDRNGEVFERWCKNLTARAVCHEVDHLDGVMFTVYTDQLFTEEELKKLDEEQDELKDGAQ